MTPDEIAGRLLTHEAECALRYRTLTERLSSIEQILNRSVFSLFGGMALIIAWLVAHYVLVK